MVEKPSCKGVGLHYIAYNEYWLDSQNQNLLNSPQNDMLPRKYFKKVENIILLWNLG